MIPRPREIFDRHDEWAELTAFVSSPGAGMRLALVYGKRRQGKSMLLRALAGRTKGLYHQALGEERAPALASFGRDASAAARVGGLRPSDWSEAIASVLRLGGRDRPTCVVIDELPYLLKHSPELPSVLQRVYDDSRGGPPSRLILCGSVLSTMVAQQTSRAPLYGRIERALLVRPFDVRTARRFWRIRDRRLAFEVDAILGGTPAYRDVMGDPPPSRRALGNWLSRGPLDRNSLLYREPDLLFAEELATSDRSLFGSVMAAIGRGATGPGQIAAAVGRDLGTVQHVLRRLVAAEMVERVEDALRRRRPILRLVDPLVRFHNVVVRSNVVAIEQGRGAEVWERARDDFSSHILGPHLEALARWWTQQRASERTLGGPVGTVAPTVVNDAAGRTRHQVDVVALSIDGRRILLLGEAKVRRCGLADLRRLDAVRGLIGSVRTAGSRLALFSATGFDVTVQRAAADRDDVELVGLHRLYDGD